MIESDARFNVVDHEEQDFYALEVYIDFFRGVPGLHHVAFPQFAAVAEDVEHDAGNGRLADLVVYAHRGGKTLGPAFQVDVQRAYGMGAQAVFEFFAADGKRMPVHGFIRLRLAPGLLDLAQVERIERHGFGRMSGQGKADCGQERRWQQHAQRGCGKRPGVIRSHDVLLPWQA